MGGRVRMILQEIAEAIDFHSDLPTSWSTFNNFISFSKTKTLYDYQEEAIKNAIKILYLYFHNTEDYEENESLEVNEKRKKILMEEYERRGLESRFLDIRESRSRKVYNILSEFFKAQGNIIPFEQLINRMTFWMATGSGKTLVIVKLIEILNILIKRKEIPPCDILVLTCREDLVKKMREYVREYNEYDNVFKIRLWSLKDFNKVKSGAALPKGESTIDVFLYRSDLISDEEKEKFIDFRNYENDGKWYILLDEAHKGDKDESKRQAFYSIMSRNGFLFNFSATFTHPMDICTTVYNFNLGQYVVRGYGKNVYISEQEYKAFREEDFSGIGKQKIVLKTLILFTYLKKVYKKIKEKMDLNIYHIPMMLTLTHTVNPKHVDKEPDLVMFFREIEKIAREEVDNETLEEAKADLISELENHRPYVFGSETLLIDSELLASITYKDILLEVFNSGTRGNIEVLIRPSNKQELVFKLKTSERPFALVKIGDISSWLKETLSGYEIIERWEDESLFERINEDDSDINILMGSRAFYEGWDSNRPNIITFINIGMGTEARKFVIQSIGRGSRIEPIKNKRKRIAYLCCANDLEAKKIAQLIKPEFLNSIETLFIFGTNKNVINEIITTMKEVKLRLGETISLDKNPKAENLVLLIPCYKRHRKIPIEDIPKFSIDKESLALLRKYINWIGDDKILLMLHFSEANLNLSDLMRFKELIMNEDKFNFLDDDEIVHPSLLIPKLVSHVNIHKEELEKFKKLENEIVHFTRIGVYLDEEQIKRIKEKIEKVKRYPNKKVEERKLEELYGKISREEYDKIKTEIEKKYAEREDFKAEGKNVGIFYIAEHYYVPLLSTEEKVEWITHIIKTPSEHRFIRDLIKYVKQENNLFGEFDWWMFSKIDEHLDEVYIPYYDSSRNMLRKFKPDFIFWLRKGGDYYILFIDPKGITHTEFVYKVYGYEKIFRNENGSIRVFQQHGFRIKVFLNLYTEDRSKLHERMYKEYWFDSIHKSLNNILMH